MTTLATGAAQSTLERNLRALERGSPRAAAAVREATARTDLEWSETEEGAPTASIAEGGTTRLLASRKRPLTEAARFVERVDVRTHAAVAVLGFGVGHHVRALAERMLRSGVVIVYEPDAALLRAVLERIDITPWFTRANVAVVTEPDDNAALAHASRGIEGIIVLGATVLEHPASAPRLKATRARFLKSFQDLIATTRTHIATTMVQARASLRNQLMNLDRYATGPGIADLAGAASGRPAIVVSAGPSLRRNIHLLRDPRVRERFVIIAVQTVLRPLLQAGIRPHFVTALDHHEISRRFYEGLTAEDVEGVTLVAQPVANPAILESFPGTTRCVADGFLDEFLGPDLATRKGGLTPGATVAHLAYYLARHLGADPVVLIGQDLGFTDGQYYAPRAAIHNVWAGELNAFNTLEMMEWERIMRMGGHLRRMEDVSGRPILSDAQMAAYLVQFERDFAADAARGLRVIDATEGGVRKAHTTVRPLADVLQEFGDETNEGPLRLPEATAPDCAPDLARLRAHVEHVLEQVESVGRRSRETSSLLTQMLEHHDDHARVDSLITRVHALRDEVMRLAPAYMTVHRLNQTGSFRRLRADRRLALEEGLSEQERQRGQIERDASNVEWFAEAADEVAGLLRATLVAMDGGPRQFRDPSAPEPEEPDGSPAAQEQGRRTIAALIPFSARVTGLGLKRETGAAGDADAPRRTVDRLTACARVGRVVIVTDDERAAQRAVGGAGEHVEIVEAAEHDWQGRARSIGAARLWAQSCWRGGIGRTTVFDEVCDATLLAPVMRRLEIDAALLVGPEWCALDASLNDELIERHLEEPERRRLVFSQAAPGLAGCVVSRTLMEELERTAKDSGAFGTLGSLLGYVPVAPSMDPVASHACVQITAERRDAGVRLIADSSEGRHAVSQSAEITAHPRSDARTPPPSQLELELTTRSLTTRPWLTPRQTHDMTLDDAARIIESAAAASPRLALTLGLGHGGGDALLYPHLHDLLGRIAVVPVGAVHLRTDLLQWPAAGAQVESLLALPIDVFSVDLCAGSPETYRTLTGVDRFEEAKANLTRLIAARDEKHTAGGRRYPARPWIVPRITRCDLTCAEIESFYDHWQMTAGAAAIDPLPVERPGERIGPLPLPDLARRRFGASVRVIGVDGAEIRDRHG